MQEYKLLCNFITISEENIFSRRKLTKRWTLNSRAQALWLKTVSANMGWSLPLTPPKPQLRELKQDANPGMRGMRTDKTKRWPGPETTLPARGGSPEPVKSSTRNTQGVHPGTQEQSPSRIGVKIELDL